MDEQLIYGVSDFVAYVNQTLDFAYPLVTIEGELSNFRISKNRWVYFDLKDETASLRCFGTVYMLPGPLEDGMRVRVSGSPRLHPQYNFSVTVQSMTPVGEGTIRRAADLLQAKLAAEGLFDEERKRLLPYPPRRIGLITSASSAARADFIKILNVRWRGVIVEQYDVLVQGEQAPNQITAAITTASALPEPPEVLVLIRGGGSAEDLAAFSTEQVTRAVAASRIPTLVAIGHEVDLSLAELAADSRASTPSNAAELLTPDRDVVLKGLTEGRQQLAQAFRQQVVRRQEKLIVSASNLAAYHQQVYARARQQLHSAQQLLTAYDPAVALRRGYALVRFDHELVRSVEQLKTGAAITTCFADGRVEATVTKLTKGK